MNNKTNNKKPVNLAKFMAIIAIFASLVWSYTPVVAIDNSGKLPLLSEKRAPRKTITVVATAYNSLPEQTDDTPFTTANGSTVHRGTVASNFLPFGTYVTFPDLYGDRLFVVEDRMNARYGKGRIDLWFEDYGEAVDFGVQKIKMEVY